MKRSFEQELQAANGEWITTASFDQEYVLVLPNGESFRRYNIFYSLEVLNDALKELKCSVENLGMNWDEYAPQLRVRGVEHRNQARAIAEMPLSEYTKKLTEEESK